MIDESQGSVAVLADDELTGVLQSILSPLGISVSRASDESDLIQQVRHTHPVVAVIHSSQEATALPELCATLHRLQSNLASLIILRPEHAPLQKVLTGFPRLKVLVEPLDLSLLHQRLTESTGVSPLE